MGIQSTANQDEIKRAYRKLARKYHPDVSSEKNAEEKFKELGEAYEVLKDPEKRAAYDQLKSQGWREGQSFNAPPNWEFDKNFKGGGYTQADTHDFSDFFESLFGREGFRQGWQNQRQAYHERGEDIQYVLEIDLEEAFHGGKRRIELVVPEFDEKGYLREKTKTIDIKIPRGVITGQQIRLRGQGGPGRGGPNGDLYLTIKIKPHKHYQVDGRDLSLTLPITPWEAALGAKIVVPTLSGKIEIKIPANSQTGNKLRIKGRGLIDHHPGDLYVVLQVVVPPVKTEEEKQLFQQMAEKIPFKPRENLGV